MKRGYYERTPEHKKKMSRILAMSVSQRKRLVMKDPKHVHQRVWAHKRKRLSKEESFSVTQRTLWFKLNKLFSRKEFVSYEDLPDALKEQIKPFEEEYIFPSMKKV